MGFITVFERRELKYLVTGEQRLAILEAMRPHMALDSYGRSEIRNLYFDTPDYRLIRRSVEKPPYKEKLRLRSYGRAKADSTVFVEIKKKYDGVVYKRRLPLPEREAMRWLLGQSPCPVDTQISREIDYFLRLWGEPTPRLYLSYEREAYYERGGGDFRVTFDDRLLFRREALRLTDESGGTPLLDDGISLMELKCSGGIPLWLVEVLSRERIYKTSFSKYGAAYEKTIFPDVFGRAVGFEKEKN